MTISQPVATLPPDPQRVRADALAGQVAALAAIPAGPRLAAALSGIDAALVTGYESVLVMAAWNRQSNHARGELLASMIGVLAHASPTGAPLSGSRQDAGVAEVSAALRLSRAAAEELAALSCQLAERLPEVLAALRAGVIDQPRARVFATHTGGLSAQHTAAIVAALLPRAPRLTTGQLMEAIAKHAIALDPRWALQRYKRGLAGRRVLGRRNPDGTANLGGYQLPFDQVAAVCARLDALARAAKTSGHPDRLDHLRAEVLLGLTTGRYRNLTDQQIINRLWDLTDAYTTDEDAPTPSPPDDNDDYLGPDDWPDNDRPDNDRPDDRGGDPDSGADSGADSGGGVERPAAGLVVGRRAGMRLWVGLPTLLGADRRPGEVLGWGPVHAELARHIAATAACSWWAVLTGPDTTPRAIVPIRARPQPAANPAPPTVLWGEVWIHLTADTLAALPGLADPGRGWRAVIDEITTRLGAARAGPPITDQTARLPGQALRRWIAVRDHRCPFPTCRAPAHRGEADHSIEHAKGGPTVDTNLTQPCRTHHRLREHGWRLHHDPRRPGHVTWTSRLGHRYHRQPQPGLDRLPDPMRQAAREQHPEPYQPDPWDDQPNCLYTPQTGPAPEQRLPPATPEPSNDNEIPPF